MDNFFSLFRRYLNDKAKGNEVYDFPLQTAGSRLTHLLLGLGIVSHLLPRGRLWITRAWQTPSLSVS